MHYRIFFILLLLPAITAFAAGKPKNSAHGTTTGGYTANVVGDINGAAGISVSNNAITLVCDLKLPDGSTVNVTFGGLALLRNRFQGNTAVNGVNFYISGRIDIPAGNDIDLTDSQYITGRVSAGIVNPAGKMGRVVGIQNPGSRAPASPPRQPAIGPNGSGYGNSGNGNNNNARHSP